jgi:hypothetical protein
MIAMAISGECPPVIEATIMIGMTPAATSK